MSRQSAEELAKACSVLEAHIATIEVLAVEQGLARTRGTILQRILAPPHAGGYRWALGIGGLADPKAFFYEGTIHEALQKAEKWLRKIGKTPKERQNRRPKP